MEVMVLVGLSHIEYTNYVQRTRWFSGLYSRLAIAGHIVWPDSKRMNTVAEAHNWHKLLPPHTVAQSKCLRGGKKKNSILIKFISI